MYTQVATFHYCTKKRTRHIHTEGCRSLPCEATELPGLISNSKLRCSTLQYSQHDTQASQPFLATFEFVICCLVTSTVNVGVICLWSCVPVAISSPFSLDSTNAKPLVVPALPCGHLSSFA
jgi:hypothetical protein